MRFLIIRLSSFGDIVQCQSAVSQIKDRYPQADITWVTKKEFGELVKLNPEVDQIITFDKKDGLKGWIKLCCQLRKLDFTHMYDAHANVRSAVLRLLMSFKIKPSRKIVRSKSRIKRFLLFKLGLNLFPKPFKGMISYQVPLKKIFPVKQFLTPQSWDFSRIDTKKINKLIPTGPFVCLAPGAAWEMKRWPIEHWKKLSFALADKNVVILGGKEDVELGNLMTVSHGANLAGKLSLIESCYVLSRSKLFVSGDTGLMDVADILNVPAILLMGPTAFGFATHPNVQVMEVEMRCRPCTKDGSGRCSQNVYQKCMVDITPDSVYKEAVHLLN